MLPIDALLIQKDLTERQAERVFRAVGNSSGRGRLRPDGTLIPTKQPRCLVLSTGEELPEGGVSREEVIDGVVE